MESGPRHSRARLALAALLVPLAFSLAAAWGRKPPREEEVKVTLRPLSASEVMAILQKFPEMVPSYLDDQRTDTALLKLLFPFKEVTSAPTERVFPGVRFYQGLDRSRSCGAEYPYMLAIAGGKRYAMPGHFNRLLFDNGMKVTDKNIIGLAEALLITSVGSAHRSCPDITFLGATRTKMEAWATDAAQLRVRIGGQIQEWHFDVLRNQFDGVSSVDGKDLIRDYSVIMVESPPKR